MTGHDLRCAVEDFLTREVRLLDSRRFDAWRDLFTDDALYWAPARPGQTDPDRHVCLIRDTRDLLDARVRRLMDGRAHAQNPPSRTRRIVGNVEIETATADEVRCHAGFIMLEFRAGARRLFGGDLFYRLARADDVFRIREKRVALIDCDAPHEAMLIPF